MPQDLIAVLQTRWSRFPSVRKSILQKLVSSRIFVPDGNCRHCTQSGGVVNEEDVFIRNNYIVRKFVLGDHFSYGLRMNNSLWFS